ncbi:CoA ester lyase [Comamonas sp. A7-5]|uniref:HpcH/HpaI aldolase/citrate lyase family protein n=1 Tax=Comamonas sp. A7-5 TaxID=673549 RepID=UPI0031DCB3FC
MTALRSMLFVPADSDRKLAKAVDSRADALILDLEDSVADGRKPLARSLAAEFIAERKGQGGPALYVRINPLDTEWAIQDLAAVCLPGVAGIVLPKIHSVADITRLAYGLDALEARTGMAAGQAKIVAVATETPQAILNMHGYASGAPGLGRLAGLIWGAEDLSTAIGATSNREASGEYSPLYVLASALCLSASAAANVPAIDTLYADFKDERGLEDACRASRSRGFRGRIAIHPSQVDIINTSYSPSPQELVRAQRIVDAFANHPQAGALSIDGLMVDKPHLIQSLRTLGSNFGSQ